MPSRMQRRGGLALQRGVARGDIGQIDCLLVHHLGDDVIGAPVYREQAEGREVARVGGTMQAFMRQQVHHAGGLRRTRAAK